MESFTVPTEEPSITFPVGAIIEDDKAVYKILEPVVVQGKAHKYKVEIMQHKKPIPDNLKQYLEDTKLQWILVLAQNLPLIKRIA